MADLSTRKDAFSIERYKIIPKDADYITLSFGINDDNLHQGAPIGEIKDTETSTFLGAWNTVLEYLITNHPYAKIGIIVPNGCTNEYAAAKNIETTRRLSVFNLSLKMPDKPLRIEPSIAIAMKNTT